MKRFLIPLGLAVTLFAAQWASAQTAQSVVVSSCGTPPVTYKAGQSYPQTQNTSGLECTSSSFSPSGTQDVNVIQIGGVTVLKGAGATGTGSQRETVAQDTTTIAGSAPGTAGTASANVVTVQGIASATPVLVSGTITAVTTITNPVGVKGADGSTISSSSNPVNVIAGTQTDTVMIGGVNVKEINAVTPLMGNGATGTGALRVSIASDSTGVVQPGNTANTTPWLVQSVPGTTNGASVSSKIVPNNTTSVAIKASAGTLYGIKVFNNSATIAYLKLYDTAQGSVTCGTPTPNQRILIPASTSGAGAVFDYTVGVVYGTAITACVTTGIADNDTSAPAASVYITEFTYK